MSSQDTLAQSHQQRSAGRRWVVFRSAGTNCCSPTSGRSPSRTWNRGSSIVGSKKRKGELLISFFLQYEKPRWQKNQNLGIPEDVWCAQLHKIAPVGVGLSFRSWTPSINACRIFWSFQVAINCNVLVSTPEESPFQARFGTLLV